MSTCPQPVSCLTLYRSSRQLRESGACGWKVSGRKRRAKVKLLAKWVSPCKLYCRALWRMEFSTKGVSSSPGVWPLASWEEQTLILIQKSSNVDPCCSFPYAALNTTGSRLQQLVRFPVEHILISGFGWWSLAGTKNLLSHEPPDTRACKETLITVGNRQ